MKQRKKSKDSEVEKEAAVEKKTAVRTEKRPKEGKKTERLRWKKQHRREGE